MLLELLDQKNPEYLASEKTWRQCSALYHGGELFKSLLKTFLAKNPAEENDTYELRRSESAYSSYLGPIVDYFVSWLFSSQFTVRALGDTTETPAFYHEFENDIGGAVKLVDFMRERMTTALVEGCAHWLVQMPDDGKGPSPDRADWESRGLGRAKLKTVERTDVWDWDVDDHGKLEWCVIHTQELVRKDFKSKRDTTRETWQYFDREDVTTYVLEYETAKKRPRDPKTEVPQIGEARPHGCAEVPLATLRIRDGMWIGDRVRAPQIEHFRLSCANAWLIRRTCYAMPVLNLEDTNSVPVMGGGRYVAIGVEEKFGWNSPPSTPFDVISKEISAKRDEIFRIVHQMAQALDNNAETVGRSADSKGMDVAATRIMLLAYGAMVRAAIEETYEIMSDAREEALDWIVEGFNGFDTTSAADLIATAANAKLMGIPSSRFAAEIEKKAALAMLPEAPAQTKEIICQQIDAAHTGHADDDMMLSGADLVKVEIEKIKAATALKVQDKKGKVALQVQESKAANVRLEVSMAGKQPDAVPADQKHLDAHVADTSMTKGSKKLLMEDG